MKLETAIDQVTDFVIATHTDNLDDSRRLLRQLIQSCRDTNQLAELAVVIAEATVGHLTLTVAMKNEKVAPTGYPLYCKRGDLYAALMEEIDAELHRRESPESGSG